MSFPKHCGTKVAHEKNFARSQSSSALICEANSSLLLNVLAKNGVYSEVGEVGGNS